MSDCKHGGVTHNGAHALCAYCGILLVHNPKTGGYDEPEPDTVPCFGCERPMRDLAEARGPYLHELADIIVLVCSDCDLDPERLRMKGLRPLTPIELRELSFSPANNWRH